MSVDDCYQLGHVIRTHGLKGDITILLDVDHPEDYQNMESVFVEIDRNLVPFFIESVRITGNRASVKLEDVDSLESAERLRGARLFLPLDNLPELDETQFYFHEIVGFAVVDKALGELGTVKEVYSSGVQSTLAMNYKDSEILIPVVDHVIGKVDRKERKLYVDLPEGLLDIYLDK